MIIFNNNEISTSFTYKNEDKIILDIASANMSIANLYEYIVQHKEIPENVTISAYSMDAGTVKTFNDYEHKNDSLYNSEVMAGDDIEFAQNNVADENKKRDKIFEAFEQFIFSSGESKKFKKIDTEINLLESQLALGLGIMPTIDKTDKSLKELLRLSDLGNLLYWDFKSIGDNNHLPSEEDILFFDNLNSYEKRVITESGAHPQTMLLLAKQLKSLYPFKVLTKNAAKQILSDVTFNNEDGSARGEAKNPFVVAALQNTPGGFITTPNNWMDARNVYFYKSFTPEGMGPINEKLNDSKFATYLLNSVRSTSAKNTTGILATSGYLPEGKIKILSINDINNIYDKAASDIKNNKLQYNIDALNEWRDNMKKLNFFLVMWYNRVCFGNTNISLSSYSEVIESYELAYDKFLNKNTEHTDISVDAFAKKSFKVPAPTFMEEASNYSKAAFKNFVPQVLAEYVIAQYLKRGITDQSTMTGPLLKEIVESFNRTSVTPIAQLRNPALFAFSNEINFTEIRQDIIEALAVYANDKIYELKNKGFIEWFNAHKNELNASDIVEVCEKLSHIEHFDLNKSALELTVTMDLARAQADCRNYENRYNYRFADNELAIKGRHVIAQDKKLKMYMLPANDWRNFTVGYDTHCCQHWGGAGGTCVWKLTTDPFAGVVVIERDGEIKGQGFVWTDEAQETFVFDNMEFANDGDVKNFESIIAAWAEKMPYKNIHIGTGYLAAGMRGWGGQVENPVSMPTTLSNDHVYSDYRAGARIIKNNGEVLIQNKNHAIAKSRPDEPTRWDILARPENAMFINDYNSSVEDRLRMAEEFSNNPSPEVQMRAVQFNPMLIKFIENPTEEVQVYVVRRNDKLVSLINNPCPAVQEVLIEKDPNSIKDIANPAENLKTIAFSYNGLLLKYFPESSEEAVEAAVRQNGYAIEFAANPSENAMRLAIEQNPKVISLINEPTEDMQMLAIDMNPDIVELINDPSPSVQIYAAHVEPYSILNIKEPCYEAIKEAIESEGLLIRKYQYLYPELRLTALQNNGFAIRCLKDPTEEEWIAAATQNPMVTNLINDPDLLANVLDAVEIVRE